MQGIKVCYNTDMKPYRLIIKAEIALLALAMLAGISGCSGVVINADSGHALVINEVVLSNSRSLADEEFGTPDWVEIYNLSDRPVSLEGYGLSDNIKDPHKWVFPDVTIEAGGYIVVFAAKKDAPDALCTGFGLSRNGETLLLTDRYYNVLQQLDVPSMDADISYARRADGSYGYCVSPTPRKANDTAIEDGVESLDSSSTVSDLKISEVVPGNSATRACSDNRYYPMAELFNASTLPVLLSQYFLSDDTSSAMKWRLPDVTLEPGGYVLVFFSGLDKTEGDELHASFKLGNADDTLILTGNDGVICQQMSWELNLPDDISVVGDRLYCGTPTPLAPNDGATFDWSEPAAMDQSDPVRLNEALVENRYSITDEDGDRSPWVELFNSSSAPVSLFGYCLSDDLDKPFKCPLPDITIEAGGYVVIFADGKDKVGDAIHTRFKLSRDDGAIILSNRNGLRIDMLNIDPAVRDNVSIGPDGSGGVLYYTAPTPGTANSSHSSSDVITASLPDMDGVYISEVCSSPGLKSDESDWIELYNASTSDIDLSGWRLTDDIDQPDKFTFSDLTIDTGGYAVVNAGSGKGVYAPFSISDNETIFLIDGDGNIRDAFDVGTLYKYGETSGRVLGDPSARRVYYSSATKGGANGTDHLESRVLAPVFSDCSLYHSGPADISIACATADASIRYTTDGSAPTRDSNLYSGPLTITKNTVLRAIAYKEGLIESESVTSTYLFEEPHTVPVVCLSAGAEDFEAVYSVIDRWKKVDRPAYFEFYDSDGGLGTKFPCTIRANGASTLTYKQKSLSVALRGGYGYGSTNYQFFAGNDVSVYRSLVLRNSGQDYAKARLRDSFFSRAVEGMNVDNSMNRPCVLYINGRYWGLYDLTENQNEDYLESHYGVDADGVNIIRRNETPLEGDRSEMYRVRAFARDKDLSVDSVYQEFMQWVDEDYFTDYVIAQTYFSNSDMFNQKYWRSGDYSLKWRPVFYDLDWGMNSSDPKRNMLHSYFIAEGVPSADESLTNMDIFCGLRKNAGWCDRFCERYVYVVYNFFTPERMTGILDELSAEMRPEMARHIARWGKPESVSSWEKSVASLRKCLQERQAYALDALQREFSLSGSKMDAYKQKALAGSQHG